MKIRNIITTIMSAGIAMFVLSATANAEETDDGMNTQEHTQHHKQMKHKMMKRHRKHVDQRILKMDSNGDGKIDLDEYLAHAEKNFSEMDADGDKFVTPEEARQRHQQMRKRHQEGRKEMHKKMETEERQAAEE